MPICKASEIPRNEAYIEVRRSDPPSPMATDVAGEG